MAVDGEVWQKSKHIGLAVVRRWNVFVSFRSEENKKIREKGKIRCCSKQCRGIIHIATFAAYKWKNMLSSSHFFRFLLLSTVNASHSFRLLRALCFVCFSFGSVFWNSGTILWYDLFLNNIKYLFCLLLFFIPVDTKFKWKFELSSHKNTIGIN